MNNVFNYINNAYIYNLFEKISERWLSQKEKPFVILLNCISPKSDAAKQLAEELTEKYSVPVLPVNCLELEEEDIKEILSGILFEFPLKEININFH